MWSPDTLHAGLSAQRLVLAGTGAMRPGRMLSCDSLECAPADAAPWQPAVAALAQRLAAQRGRRPALRVVLSGRFVRWQLLPWRAELTRPQEVAAFAQLRFRETYGKAAEEWRVLHAPQPPGRAVPACAVDAALLDALRKTSKEAGARLAAVTPYFASAFDRWRGNLKNGSAWFGLIEPDCLSLGLLREGGWIGLRAQRLGEDWREALPGLMAQIGIPAGADAAPAPLYLAGEGEAPAPAADLPFTWLRPQATDCRPALGI